MHIGVIGLNHKSASLELRETLARIFAKKFGHTCDHDFPFVLLSTCNRTEIYFSSDDLADTHSYLLGNLRTETSEEFEHTIYSYFGSDCFFHLAKVACGMDSAIIGETEIQGQVKQAYEEAASTRALSRELHFLFQKSLKIGKDIRTNPLMPTLEEAVLNLSTSHLKDLKTKKILFFGVSEINQKILKLLTINNIQSITLCNRTHAKALMLARALNVEAVEKVEDIFAYDLIIYGTKAPTYLMTKNALEMPRQRKLIIDLSVPRNVEPACATIPNVTLLNVDQINRTIDRRKKRKAALLSRLRLPQIEEAVNRQILLFHKRESFLLSLAS